MKIDASMMGNTAHAVYLHPSEMWLRDYFPGMAVVCVQPMPYNESDRQRITAAKQRARVITRAKGSKRHGD